MGTGRDDTTREENERLVRRYWEECRNQRNFALVDELFADDHRGHGFGGSEGWEGVEGLKEFIRMDHRAFPDAEYDIEHLVVGDDKVVTRWTFHGTHEGDLELFDTVIEPTDREVAVPGTVIDRIEDGTITETWVTIDTMSLVSQLGIDPGRVL